MPPPCPDIPHPDTDSTLYLIYTIKVGFAVEKWTTQNKSISIKETSWLSSALNSKI